MTISTHDDLQVHSHEVSSDIDTGERDHDSIVSHVNVHEDPSTGHMLQTLQIV